MIWSCDLSLPTDTSHSLCLWQIIVWDVLPPPPAPPPLGPAHSCLSVSVTHTSSRSACQSPTKFPGSQYIWQYFISDLRISERISVQAGSLAWKCRSVWKARSLHDAGALHYTPPPFFPSYIIPSLSPSLSVVDLAVSGCLTQHWVTPQGAKYS